VHVSDDCADTGMAAIGVIVNANTVIAVMNIIRFGKVMICDMEDEPWYIAGDSLY
jgi:hypothetical protein